MAFKDNSPPITLFIEFPSPLDATNWLDLLNSQDSTPPAITEDHLREEIVGYRDMDVRMTALIAAMEERIEKLEGEKLMVNKQL